MTDPRPVAQTRERLNALERTIKLLRADLADLYDAAWTQPHESPRPAPHRRVGHPCDGHDDPEARSPRPAYGDRAGEWATSRPVARRVWRNLEDEVRRVDMQLDALRAAVGNVLSSGPGANGELRGTTIDAAEFAQKIHSRGLRAANIGAGAGLGEIVNNRVEEQPKFPAALNLGRRKKRRR